ncbi:hypothetical protein MIMGU_mgv1a0033732mg, partial [Erythranthe guttata]
MNSDSRIELLLFLLDAMAMLLALSLATKFNSLCSE